MTKNTKHDVHTCKARGCTKIINRAMLMCNPHWYEVPADLRREVNSAWQAWKANSTLEAMQIYIAVRNAAINSVGSTPQRPPAQAVNDFD